MLVFGGARSSFDFDSLGKSAGFIDVDHLDNENAFGAIRVPIGLINGGDGPTVLLTAGNHGDEYEGQIILHRLMQHMQPSQVSGRIIMIPALNTPAVLDRARVSPLDQGNMNRSFPGAEGSGPTKSISGFVSTFLIPMADSIMDFHSGGTTAQYVNCGFHCRGDNASLNGINLALAEAFAAPFTIVCPLDGYEGDFDSAAYAQETPFVSCELGGMGRIAGESLDIGWRGCLRVLNHVGVISEDVMTTLNADVAEPSAPTRFLDLGEGCAHVIAASHGLAEQHLELGNVVQTGTPAATVYDLHNFGTEPHRLASPCDGVVTVRRRNPIVAPGQYLYLICAELTRSELE